MASPSERKEGLRCGKKDQKYPPWGTIDECPGLVLEYDPQQELGMRCYKKKCHKFHPLEVLLGQAVEQNLLSPEQLKKIQDAVSGKTTQQTQQEEAMTTAIVENMGLSKIFSELESIALTLDISHGGAEAQGYGVYFVKSRGYVKNYIAKIIIPAFTLEKSQRTVKDIDIPGLIGEGQPALKGYGSGKNFNEALLNAFKEILGIIELSKRDL